VYNSQLVVERIKRRTIELGYMFKDLNEYCGIDKTTINASATKKYGLSAKVLSDAADFLKCTVDYILGRTDKPYIPADYLTNDEQRIILMYRALTPTERANISGRLEMLTELHEQTKKQDA